ncbi:hypothetical protein C8R43DRAFT_1193462 [Mycena crocata]|nr:hypothetical protein C8R43DRAFT_1193462 [Mycena crocata]
MRPSGAVAVDFVPSDRDSLPRTSDDFDSEEVSYPASHWSASHTLLTSDVYWLLAGYDGGFEFKSGAECPDSVPYVAMRVMLATFGVGMVPLGWYTPVQLDMSQWACHLVARMALFDVGWLCTSRFILVPASRVTNARLSVDW